MWTMPTPRISNPVSDRIDGDLELETTACTVDCGSTLSRQLTRAWNNTLLDNGFSMFRLGKPMPKYSRVIYLSTV